MRKALVLFGNEKNTENLIQSCIYLRDKFGYKLTGLYISDIRKETVPIEEGMMGVVYDSTRSLIIDEWLDFEKEEFKNIEKNLKEDKLKIDIEYEVGIIGELISQHMKNYDLLIIGKGVSVPDSVVEILKNNYKSLLIIGETRINFSNIYIANDDGIKVNRSCYSFMTLFPEEKEFISVEVNTEEKNILDEYIISKDKKLKIEKLPNKDNLLEFFENKEHEGLIIMGNLSKKYLFEKLTGRMGVKLIEKSKMSIYIG